MSKVIIFSRIFPAYHPKAGQPTFFVEKILQSLSKERIFHEAPDLKFNPDATMKVYPPKYHTIRSGNRWKVGDKFSPRVWSGKPYRSEQIILTPDIEVVKVWDFKIKTERNSEMRDDFSNFIYINDKLVMLNEYEKLAANDGLNVGELCDWFKMCYEEGYKIVHFTGQIICWNSKIEY